MDRTLGIFVDGIGTAAATSGVLNQLQGRIFALLYLQPRALSLDEIAAELEQSKSNISIQVRGLVEWHLVRQTRQPGSRKDHYEAATDFWRVMQEIMERRFRWNLRQVLAAAEETERAAAAWRGEGAEQPPGGQPDFIAGRLEAVRDFFMAVDVGLSGFTRGESFAPQPLQRIVIEGDGKAAKAVRP